MIYNLKKYDFKKRKIKLTLQANVNNVLYLRDKTYTLIFFLNRESVFRSFILEGVLLKIIVAQ